MDVQTPLYNYFLRALTENFSTSQKQENFFRRQSVYIEIFFSENMLHMVYKSTSAVIQLLH